MKQFSNASTRYGAPMGRSSFGQWCDANLRSIRVFKVRLDSGGYDDGGAYWGTRKPGHSLYCCTDSADYREFIDAVSRDDAIEKIGMHRGYLMRAF